MTAWDDVKVGDLVRVTYGETSGTGRVFCGNGGALYLPLVDITRVRIKNIECDDYTLEIIEKAPVPLPTVPGLYSDNQDDPWQVTVCGRLMPLVSYAASNATLEHITKMAAEYAPFTRLTPEGE